jgi:formylglycine-generating enzyme required for sulfatase activity
MAAALEREKVALRRGRRALAGVAALFVCIIIGAIGLFNQDFLREQYQWRVVMGPSVLTAEQEKEMAAKPGSNFKECANGCPTMIVVPAGTFTMGSPQGEGDHNEHPQHEVAIAKTFAVGKTEVTFAEWNFCVAAGACAKAQDSGWGENDRPVINVSWEEAKQYAGWLSRVSGRVYRLLTEAEWEYSARAGSRGKYTWGDEIGRNRANCDGCGSQWDNRQTAPVASFQANAFGLHDMHGNVWEWVEDCAHANFDDKPEPLKSTGGAWTTGDCSGRVLRGGSWNYNPDGLRSASRWVSPLSIGSTTLASVSRGRLAREG